MHPNMKYTLCKSLFFISIFEIQVVKEERRKRKKKKKTTIDRTFEFFIKDWFFAFFSLELIGDEFGLSFGDNVIFLWNRMFEMPMVAKVRYQHVNGEKDSKSKLSLPNILFTTRCCNKSNETQLMIFILSVENPFMNEVY